MSARTDELNKQTNKQASPYHSIVGFKSYGLFDIQSWSFIVTVTDYGLSTTLYESTGGEYKFVFDILISFSGGA